ncbi:hypothetical protein KAS42_04080 [bacterium]|nr:hypothetical protein [bacterium]
MDLKGIILIVCVLALINIVTGFIDIKKFLSRVSVINSNQEMDDFKNTVRKQMYHALLQIFLIFIPTILCLDGLFTKKLSLGHFFLIIFVFNGIMFIMGKLFKNTEEQARSLTVNNENLAEEYKKICHIWLHKPFPNF